MTVAAPHADEVIAETRRWLEKAVIGLNLCPFAAHPYRSGRVRFAVSEARTPQELLLDLEAELHLLSEADQSSCETTLLIHPATLQEFLPYNDFLAECDELIESVGLEGVLQVATFHPQYQFAETFSDDIENYTNRSPYPTLHLLREESVSRAVETTDTEEIYQRNIRTLKGLGLQGWLNLWRS
ncbi:MAG TPA: DUF1415 domain-containing protein [Steroidobacteraceae bacterium]